MDITALLNSGKLHAARRAAKPDCVCSSGNIHASPERARFVSWSVKMRKMYGQDVATWPPIARAEYASKYVPSH